MNFILKRSGKVREIYDSADDMYTILVASDKVSAFDEVLPNGIPNKGKVLTRISEFWFRATRDIAPNAYITCDNSKMDSFFREENLIGRCTLMKKLTMLPIEAIVRGNITGSLWKAYKNGEREFCGLRLPEGLRESESLPDFLFTPTTKAPLGEHDQNLSYEEMIQHLEDAGFDSPEWLAEKVREYSMDLFTQCREYAKERGIIIADTKFEFGIDRNGLLLLGDELFTPDSSRFWSKADFAIGQAPPSMDKQIIRDWIQQHPGDKNVPREVLAKAYSKYIECYERLASKRF